MEYEISPGLWNSEHSSRNPESHERLESKVPLTGIQVPLTETEIQHLESRIHGVESRIQVCLGFPYIGRILYQIWFLFLGRSAWYNKVRFGEDERKCSYACVGKLAGVFEPLKPDDLMDGRFGFY